MLTSTFLHAQGIGATTERKIWEAGALEWRSFLEFHRDIAISERQRALLIPVVEESVARFESRDYRYFATRVPSREHWRAFGELGAQAAYLDIETTGMGVDSAVTVIGIYDGRTVKSFIKGYNLEGFADELEKYHLLVTYAGAMFDLPVLRHAFPGTKLEQLHIDLCPTLRRLGYKGGLKHIEQVMGISRSQGISGLDGWDAVRLWREWEYGSRESLDLLIEYNAADVVNLEALARFAYRELRQAHMPEAQNPR